MAGTRAPRARAHDLVTQQPLLPRAALESIGPQAVLLPQFAAADAATLCAQVEELLLTSAWRHMQTPGGQRMSVAMTNCGRTGWVSDRAGYRYQSVDPCSGRPWPAMPCGWSKLAASAAARGRLRRASSPMPAWSIATSPARG